jgi:acyl-CoA synthetase (AMP-forming)/AMP-acid ligase II
VTFLSRFQDIVDRQGDSIAIRDREEEWTYRALLDRGAHLAGGLRDAHIGRESIVGLSFRRSADYICALLGTWMAPSSSRMPRPISC